MNPLIIYWNYRRARWEHSGALSQVVLPVPKRSLLELQIVAAGFDFSSLSTTGVFSFKTDAQLVAGGDFTFATAGFNTLSTGHSPSTGKLAIPFTVAGSRTDGKYNAAVTLFDASNNPTQLGRFRLQLYEAGYTGTEATPPAGVGDPLSGHAEITGSNTTVEVIVANMTATGLVTCDQEGSPDDADWGGFVSISKSYAAGKFTISVPTPPELAAGDGRKFKIGWWVVRKS